MVLLYLPQEVGGVGIHFVWAWGRWETSPTKKPTRKLEIILFFPFFEGICRLHTKKSWMSMLCIKGASGYVQKTCFLDDFHETSLVFCLAIQWKWLGHGTNA
jgi:hypothetical protein